MEITPATADFDSEITLLEEKITKLKKLRELDEQKQKELELLESKRKVLDFKKQLARPGTFVHDLYSTSSPKKDAIQRWAEEIERQYELETELGLTPIVTSVSGIASYIKTEMRRMGVDPSVYSYVHKILGFKYKFDKYNHNKNGENGGENDSLLDSSLNIDPEQENEPLISLIDDQIDFLKAYRQKLKTEHALSKLDIKERLQLEEIMLKMRATQILAYHVINARQSIPTAVQHLLIASITVRSNNFLAGEFVKEFKAFGANKVQQAHNVYKITFDAWCRTISAERKAKFVKVMSELAKLHYFIREETLHKIKKENIPDLKEDTLTSKQAMKFIHSHVPEILPIFEPTSRDDAIADGFTGAACPECGSFRVEKKYHTGRNDFYNFCHACQTWYEGKPISKCWHCHFPFYDEILRIIKKNATTHENGAIESKCPKCNGDITLPARKFEKLIPFSDD